MHSSVSQSIILASRSPRRQELLTQIGVKFELLDIEIDESPLAFEDPLAYVQRMAKNKATAGWNDSVRQSDVLKTISGLLAADTSVVSGKKILGKPVDFDDAVATLTTLSGQTHQVMSSVALVNSTNLWIKTSVTQVEFAPLSIDTIKDYCSSGEGLDKAGGYAIQGRAAEFVKSINGSYSGVVGLPLYETRLLLNLHFKARK